MKTKYIFVLAIATLASLASCTNNGTSSTDVAADSTSTQVEDKHVADTVIIAMNGDVMTGSIKPRQCLPPNRGKNIFVDCDSLIRSADVACGNLEGVLADNGNVRKRPGPLSFSFMMPTSHAKLLADAGYDFMGIANNHIFDFWEEGTLNTIKTLKSAGIGVAGTKHCETSLKEIKGVKYGFCAFGHEDYSLKTQDTATVRRVIKQLRNEADIVIVCFHGGAEGTARRHVPHGTEFFHNMNRGDVRQFAHLCIDYGADIVYGHGPHVPRALELYNDHLIAYSLGNFATIGMSTTAQVGYAPLLIARLDGNGEFIDGKIHSFIQKPKQGPRKDTSNLVAKDIAELTEADISPNLLNIAPDGKITRAEKK